MEKLRDILGDVKAKNIVFLQGPMGGFFKKLQLGFSKDNKVFHIGFNKGDEFYSVKNNYHAYKDGQSAWDSYFKKFIRSNSIDIVFLFGDCRFYHQQAIDIARRLGVMVYVFEEGYIRPNYLTVEKYGVNANSALPRDKSFYESLNLNDFKDLEENAVNLGNSYPNMALQAMIYYFVSNVFQWQYPQYEHHRNFSVIKQAFVGLRSFVRKFKYLLTEANVINQISGDLSQKYYFMPLQVRDDFQLKIHSDFDSIEAFSKQVLLSFSRHAPKDKKIIIKHHPMDRGRADYSKFIISLSDKLKITDRVKVVHDVHLPTLLKNAIGTITINSTVGLSSLYHETPVIYLGRAMYDIEGLTAKDVDLDGFWSLDLQVNKGLYKKFRVYLVKNTQVNMSFYK
jgi:capsular polysaccharide export protein